MYNSVIYCYNREMGIAEGKANCLENWDKVHKEVKSELL